MLPLSPNFRQPMALVSFTLSGTATGQPHRFALGIPNTQALGSSLRTVHFILSCVVWDAFSRSHVILQTRILNITAKTSSTPHLSSNTDSWYQYLFDILYHFVQFDSHTSQLLKMRRNVTHVTENLAWCRKALRRLKMRTKYEKMKKEDNQGL